MAGRRVLVPRPAGRADELSMLLAAAGAHAVVAPLIETLPVEDDSELLSAVADLAAGTYDWVAFTAVPAVDAVLAVAARHGIALAVLRLPRAAPASADTRTAGCASAEPAGPGPSSPGPFSPEPATSDSPATIFPAANPPVPQRTRVAAVGPATAHALRAAGVPVDLQPSVGGSAVALAAAWPAEPPGRSVLLPRSDIAAPTLPDALQAAGYRVRQVVAYRTVPIPPARWIAADLASGAIDAVLLTSPSTARALIGLLARTAIAADIVVIAIGAATAAAAAAAGIPIAGTAAEPTPAALLAALVAALAPDPAITLAAGPASATTPTPGER